MLISTHVQAESNFSTNFSFALGVGDSILDVGVTSPGKRILLPSQFDNWNCSVTHQFLSPDGKSVYHNVACHDVTSDAVVGVTISCPRLRETTEFANFFLRKGGAEVSLGGSCTTKRVSR